jgi:predicted TIM-barrel fold metal-dependent hydrolase
MDVIDFHCHFAGPLIPVDAARGNPPAQKEFWDGVSTRLTQEEALLASMQATGVTTRVINTSLEFVLAPGEEAELDLVRRINDAIAGVTHRHKGLVHGLATIDAYQGEASARELERAVRDLGLKGVFIESAKGELLPDAPQARPTFLAAAELDIPVFLHPVPDATLRQKFKRSGKFSERLARSAINSAALLAMVHAGMFEEMDKLNVVVTALALGGLMVGECLADGARLGKHALPRRNVYMDTTGMHPVMLRAAIDLLGADHIVTGTDWPVVTEPDLPARLARLVDQCHLGESDRDLIANANARRLLHV